MAFIGLYWFPERYQSDGGYAWMVEKKGYRPLPEEISSMACWYQQEPHETFPVLPAVEERWDR